MEEKKRQGARAFYSAAFGLLIGCRLACVFHWSTSSAHSTRRWACGARPYLVMSFAYLKSDASLHWT